MGIPSGLHRMRLMIVGDMAVVREGVRLLLSDEPEVDVVAEARNGEEALRLMAQAGLDVILIDIDPPGGDGLTVIPQIKAHANPPGIVVMSIHAGDAGRRRVREAGVDHFLDKCHLPAEVMLALRDALRPRAA